MIKVADYWGFLTLATSNVKNFLNGLFDTLQVCDMKLSLQQFAVRKMVSLLYLYVTLVDREAILAIPPIAMILPAMNRAASTNRGR